MLLGTYYKFPLFSPARRKIQGQHKGDRGRLHRPAYLRPRREGVDRNRRWHPGQQCWLQLSIPRAIPADPREGDGVPQHHAMQRDHPAFYVPNCDARDGGKSQGSRCEHLLYRCSHS